MECITFRIKTLEVEQVKMELSPKISVKIWFDVEAMTKIMNVVRGLDVKENIRGYPGFADGSVMLVMFKLKKAMFRSELNVYYWNTWETPDWTGIVAKIRFNSFVSRQLFMDWYTSYKKEFPIWLIEMFKKYMEKIQDKGR